MSDESRWVSMNYTWGCWKSPSCWQSFNPPRGLRDQVFDQEHQPDGIRDGAVIWNGSVLGLLCVFVFEHLRVSAIFRSSGWMWCAGFTALLLCCTKVNILELSLFP